MRSKAQTIEVYPRSIDAYHEIVPEKDVQAGDNKA